jgi:hypothetical protein
MYQAVLCDKSSVVFKPLFKHCIKGFTFCKSGIKQLGFSRLPRLPCIKQAKFC